MAQSKKVKKVKSIVRCVHCNKKITKAHVIGLSLICPFCKKPFA